MLHRFVLTRFPLNRFCLVARGFCSTGHAQESSGEVDEHINEQILQAGLHYLRGDSQALRENASNRGSDANIDRLLQLHGEYKNTISAIFKLRYERKEISRQCEQLYKLKEEEKAKKKAEDGLKLKHAIMDLEERRRAKEKELIPELSLLPNYTHPDAPVGEYEDSTVVCEGGSKPEFSFRPKDHKEIGEQLGLFDFNSASDVSGPRFYYMQGAAALLEVALIQYAMQKAEQKGYTPVITPDIIKTDVVTGCGFHPRGPSTQVYHMSSRYGNLCLSGTAEIPLAGWYMNKVLPWNDLPKRLVAFGRCFRAEAGAGHAVKGLYRVHQFSKVELFGLTSCETGQESEQLLEEIVDIQKEIMSDLGLHYRLLDMATKDLGSPAYRKFDIEAWMPGRGNYGEVTSASNCTDYQSRRLRITYPNPAKRSPNERGRKYAHTVNGTACAVPRIIVALLENYQQEDGSVVLPEVLHPFIPPKYWHIIRTN